MLETYQQMKTLVDEMEEDVRKAAEGNKSAGTRVRRLMQDVKNQAQALRVKILEQRNGSSE